MVILTVPKLSLLSLFSSSQCKNIILAQIRLTQKFSFSLCKQLQEKIRQGKERERETMTGGREKKEKGNQREGKRKRERQRQR